MQILMPPNCTLISIDESKIHTHHLFSFIKNQFSSHRIDNNALYLDYSSENHFKHLFLIKWIYSIHKKVNRWDSIKLREVLINRIDKPIKIVTKQPINPQCVILIDMISERCIRLRLQQKNYLVFWEIQSLFRHAIEMISFPNHCIEIRVGDELTKKLFIDFIETQRTKHTDVIINHTLGDISKLFGEKEEETCVFNAFKNLKSAPNEPMDIIKKRYKKLLVQYHPDNVFQEGIEKVHEYTEIFKNLQVSFEIVQSHHF